MEDDVMSGLGKQEDWEILALKTIGGMKVITDRIKDDPGCEISQEELKTFMLCTSGALMALHLLMKKDTEIRRN
jgi:hypothetical protein